MANIIQNQELIIQSLDKITSKLDSLSERLSRVERKVELMDGAPPPYQSIESRRATSQSVNEEKIIREIRLVHECIALNEFYAIGRFQRIFIYGLAQEEGVCTREVTKRFLREVLQLSEENISASFGFACRLPKDMSGGAGRPAPVVLAVPTGSGRGKILKEALKRHRELKEMEIWVQSVGV